jgi:hypothetical protein
MNGRFSTFASAGRAAVFRCVRCGALGDCSPSYSGGAWSITNTLIPCWACRPAEGAVPGSSQGKTQGKLDKVKQIAPSVRKPYSGAAQLPAAAFLGGLT